MPLPPILYNCSAEICCSPAAAHKARVSILLKLGCPEDYGNCAERIATAMAEQGVAFAPASLMAEIAAMVEHPGRATPELEGGGALPGPGGAL